MYLFDYNGLTVAHLGDIQKVPTQGQIEALEEVNILLLPVGGGSSLNASQAAEIVSMIEPNIVIPMHYRMDGLKFELNELERFLKEMGATDVEPEAKLRISASNLPEQAEVVVLLPKI